MDGPKLQAMQFMVNSSEEVKKEVYKYLQSKYELEEPTPTQQYQTPKSTLTLTTPTPKSVQLEPLFEGRTSREIIKDLCYNVVIKDCTHIGDLFDKMTLDEFCKNPNLHKYLPHRMVAMLIDNYEDGVNDFTVLMSKALTNQADPLDVEECMRTILNTKVLETRFDYLCKCHTEYYILSSYRENVNTPLRWKDIPEPRLSQIANTSALGHSLQECIDRYLGNL